MPVVSFRVKQDKAEIQKQKVTVTSVAVVTMKFLIGMCNCMADSDVGKSNLLLVMGILHMCVDMHTCNHMCLWIWTAIS